MGTPIAELVAERAHRFGPLPFDEVMQLALYDPDHGFYSRGGMAGRRGDFLTSPEVGPLFGAVVARALDRWWDGLGRPDPFIVVEAGAGVGSLARDVMRAAPRCLPALRYVLVEQSDRLREQQVGRVPLEPARQVLGPIVVDDVDEGPHTVPGVGPLATSLAELPQRPFVGVVLANELLDNLAFDLLQRGDDGWREVRVGEQLDEVLVPARDELAQEAGRLVPHPATGARLPVQRRAGEWVRSALSVLERGRVVVVDYAADTASMAARPWTEWVRTYRAHGRGTGPLDDLGEQDITCEVAVDQLPAPDRNRSQTEFLRAHGIDDLAAAARSAWEERAHIGDLDALKQRSRVTEAAALTDDSGLGAFRVLEWEVGG